MSISFSDTPVIDIDNDAQMFVYGRDSLTAQGRIKASQISNTRLRRRFPRSVCQIGDSQISKGHYNTQPSSVIAVGDLVNLNVGDVIPLGQDADGELDVLIEGVSKYKCFFGVSRGNRAIQLTRLLDE